MTTNLNHLGKEYQKNLSFYVAGNVDICLKPKASGYIANSETPLSTGPQIWQNAYNHNPSGSSSPFWLCICRGNGTHFFIPCTVWPHKGRAVCHRHP
jgi:hypothetical protein